jgi:uncharacterized protein YdeI (YjbR/CyaY-like superfamily)
MKENIAELLFPASGAFRAWLTENAETSGGVWLVFGKTKEVETLTANDALEEALCFGWIDGRMKSVDETKYVKYFSKRRAKSVWSEKNKKTAERLRSDGRMTALGEKAIDEAKKNGEWDKPKDAPADDGLIAALTARLSGLSPAYENYMAMPPSVRRTYARRYASFKTEDARERDFAKIVERLNNNLKPM